MDQQVDNPYRSPWPVDEPPVKKVAEKPVEKPEEDIGFRLELIHGVLFIPIGLGARLLLDQLVAFPRYSLRDTLAPLGMIAFGVACFVIMYPPWRKDRPKSLPD